MIFARKIILLVAMSLGASYDSFWDNARTNGVDQSSFWARWSEIEYKLDPTYPEEKPQSLGDWWHVIDDSFGDQWEILRVPREPTPPPPPCR
jgi:hypothetical protein